MRYLSLILLPLLMGCSTFKIVKVLTQGSVAEKHFKVQVPFEMRYGLIVLKLKVNGSERTFILDTGAPNAISKELAAELKIKPTTRHKTGDSQGAKSVLEYAVLQNVELGGVRFEKTGAAIVDMNHTKELACFGADGLLGANLMKKAIWQIDYEKKIITIASSRDSLSIPTQSQLLPFRQALTGTPLIDVSYNSIVDKRVTLDLGSNADFCSSRDVLQRLRKKDSLMHTTYSFGSTSAGIYGKGGPDTAFYGLLPVINLGEIALHNQVVDFERKKARTVGTGFFKNYLLTLDWSKNQVILARKRDYNNTIEKKLPYGLVYREGKIYICLVFSKLCDLRVGDQVLRVNEKDYTECSPSMLCELIEKNFAGPEEVSLLVLRDGQKISLRIKRQTLYSN
jgi:hypothetical protein